MAPTKIIKSVVSPLGLRSSVTTRRAKTLVGETPSSAEWQAAAR